jgi:hypothetical protein
VLAIIANAVSKQHFCVPLRRLDRVQFAIVTSGCRIVCSGITKNVICLRASSLCTRVHVPKWRTSVNASVWLRDSVLIFGTCCDRFSVAPPTTPTEVIFVIVSSPSTVRWLGHKCFLPDPLCYSVWLVAYLWVYFRVTGFVGFVRRPEF